MPLPALCLLFAPLGVALGIGLAITVDPLDAEPSRWPVGGVVAQPETGTPPTATPVTRQVTPARKAPQTTARQTVRRTPARAEPTPTVTPDPTPTAEPTATATPSPTPGCGDDDDQHRGKPGKEPDPCGDPGAGQGGGQGEQCDPATGECPGGQVGPPGALGQPIRVPAQFRGFRLLAVVRWSTEH